MGRGWNCSSFSLGGSSPPDEPFCGSVRRFRHDLPIFDVDIVQSALDQTAWPLRVFGSLFLAFGLAALFLAAAGLYGVMAFSVRRRTREIGIRMALGASARSVLGRVLAQGLWRIALGIALGVGLGATLGSTMSMLLFRVGPYDPWVFTVIALVLTLTGIAACFVPARRAAHVDPLSALRHE